MAQKRITFFAFDTKTLRSELVALNIEVVTVDTADSGTMVIGSSTTDQEEQGPTAYLRQEPTRQHTPSTEAQVPELLEFKLGHAEID